MAYTAPTTRTTGTLITASIWNTDLVDNIAYLKSDVDLKYYGHGWMPVTGTWTYASATAITVPSGAASIYNKGSKFKLTANGVVLQGYIVGVADTLLTVAGDALTNHTFSSVYYSNMENPLGFPDSFVYTATPTGFSANPTTVARFTLRGRTCTVFYRTTGAGTSNATSFTIAIPITAATGSGYVGVVADLQDNSAAAAAGSWLIASGGTTAALYKSAAAGWTASGSKYANAMLVYEI